jgi:hypothetical protein
MKSGGMSWLAAILFKKIRRPILLNRGMLCVYNGKSRPKHVRYLHHSRDDIGRDKEIYEPYQRTHGTITGQDCR